VSAEVEEAVRRTIARYCQTCDDGRFDEFGECFAADAVMTVLGREVRGREAIRDWIAAAMPPEKRGKHVAVNTVIDVGDRAGAVRASTDYLFVARTEKGPRVTTTGRYVDTFVRDGDRWLFQTRDIHID